MTGFLLDTHYWIWLQLGDEKQVQESLRDELLELQRNRSLYLSLVSVWEVARLAADGHIELGMSVDQFLEEATRSGGLQILPLSARVLIESTRLPGSLHRDPADRMLVASAREHGLTLLSRDKEILRYAQHGYLNVRKA